MDPTTAAAPIAAAPAPAPETPPPTPITAAVPEQTAPQPPAPEKPAADQPPAAAPPAPPPVRPEQDPPAEAPAETDSLGAAPGRPAAHFAVGDRVAGSGRVVHGVRVTAEREFIQFSTDGAWLPADDFDRVDAQPAGE